MRRLATDVLGPLLGRIPLPALRKWYWQLRARDIDAAWGQDTADHAALLEVLRPLQPRRLLDVGCGSGRLFPVYRQLGVAEVVAQDIALEALRLCARRYPDLTCTYRSEPVESLDYPDAFFDVTVANRVLSAVPPERLPEVLTHVCRLSRAIYLNEFSESDGGAPSNYWFRHDYGPLLAAAGFAVVATGRIGVQTWQLAARS